MATGEHQTRTTATRTNPTPGSDGGVPVSTWVIGTAAFLLVLTAGALFLDKEDEEREPPTNLAETTPTEEAKEVKLDPVAVTKKKDPLDLTATFLDATERARLWNPKAALAGLELVVVDGVPSGPIKFDFGESIGQAMPGTPLSAKRHTLNYEADQVDASSMDSPKRRVALPEPNCPLDIAFKTLAQSGITTTGRVGVLYLQSEKHGRPVWLMTNEAGQASHINADSCALLRR